MPAVMVLFRPPAPPVAPGEQEDAERDPDQWEGKEAVADRAERKHQRQHHQQDQKDRRRPAKWWSPKWWPRRR